MKALIIINILFGLSLIILTWGIDPFLFIISQLTWTKVITAYLAITLILIIYNLLDILLLISLNKGKIKINFRHTTKLNMFSLKKVCFNGLKLVGLQWRWIQVINRKRNEKYKRMNRVELLRGRRRYLERKGKGGMGVQSGTYT